MRTTTIYLTAACLLTAMTMGCAHNAPPPMAPTPVQVPMMVSEAYGDDLPTLPPPSPTPPTPTYNNPTPTEQMVEHTAPLVVCQQMTVKVGKLDVNMPKGGSLEIMGVKSATSAYHIALEGVEFSYKDCQ